MKGELVGQALRANLHVTHQMSRYRKGGKPARIEAVDHDRNDISCLLSSPLLSFSFYDPTEHKSASTTHRDVFIINAAHEPLFYTSPTSRESTHCV